MRVPALVIGLLLLIAGGLISAGVLKFEREKNVVDLGPIEISRTATETPPVNLGWILLGVGGLLVVVGLVSRKK
jgi:uncharacterized membrane protein YphA (DoxX/SURF4 family)